MEDLPKRLSEESLKASELIVRLDRIPVWPYSYWLLIIIGLAFTFSFFDIVTIGIALPVIQQQFHVSTAYSTWAITAGLLGYIIGAFLDGMISDKFGRRFALLLSIAFFSVGSILMAFSPNMVWLIIFRVVVGMGIGADIDGTCTYFADAAPKACRGRLTAISIFFAFVGFAIVPFVGLALVPYWRWGWRMLFVIGGLGGIIIFIARRRLVGDTIRWMIARFRGLARQDLAAYQDTLAKHKAKLEQEGDVPDEMSVHDLLERNLLKEAEEHVIKAEQTAEKRMKKALSIVTQEQIISHQIPSGTLLDFRAITYVVLFGFIWFFYYLGNYAWLTLNTKLFLLDNFKLSNSILMVGVNSIGFLVGSAITIFIIDRVERKWLAVIISFFWGALLLLIGWLPRSETLILVLGFFAAVTISMFIPLVYTLTTESFPTKIRNTSVALSDGLGHLGGAFCGQIVFAFYYAFNGNGHGFNAAFTAMAVSGFIAMVLLCFIPRLTGKAI